MNLSLHPPCLRKTISCSAARKRNEKHDLVYQNKKSNSPFPKSYPTPLLPVPKFQPQSKIQALETVLNKIESSVKNGIEINDPQIFASLLETCFQLKAIDHGIQIHKLIPDKLLRKNVGISSKLLRLYAYGGHLEKAHEVFDEMPDRNSSAFAWNSLISGYAETGLYEDALALYFQMVEEGVDPDQHTFPRVLKACGGVGMIQVGEEIHRHIIRSGLGKNTFILNALLDMYSKCGNIARARKVFNCIENKELVSWNSMINGYIKHGLILKALLILRRMLKEGFEPESVTLSSILTAASPYRIGTQIHGWALRRGIEWNLSVANSLIIFYSNRNNLIRARWLFENMPDKDVVSWNSIISAHSKDSLALDYLNRMMGSNNVSPDGITFVSLLSMCANLKMVKEGERIFSMMLKRYEISPSMEHYACMVNLYGRAGLVKEAYEFIVGRMEIEAGPTVWGALLYGCYLHGVADIGEIAAEHLFEMEPDGEHNFELLINIYRKDGRYEGAERIKGMMMERGLQM
ncbi:pentatricopeptide repeat-containing protein at4g25270 chloroplastic [Phtheirospermum japonicum]|uniref:Pentatricopeptide repeat-containing protein at4g25270 chloroplastic n=1 Tax=Phtheirospermum japonicum TaxID=374723 RepID=A0A830BYA0_9LAMI|nr:pentatricopeptide repeat-containing protein at4g25270 chloroplastic [Phtheirospermum japonicum]